MKIKPSYIIENFFTKIKIHNEKSKGISNGS